MNRNSNQAGRVEIAANPRQYDVRGGGVHGHGCDRPIVVVGCRV